MNESLLAFAKNLAHKIRTPLSVILTDLVYFKTLLPAGEADRTLRKCAEMGEMLSALIKAVDPNAPRESFNLLELLSGREGVASGSAVLCANKDSISLLIENLFSFFSLQQLEISSVLIQEQNCCLRIYFKQPVTEFANNLPIVLFRDLAKTSLAEPIGVLLDGLCEQNAIKVSIENTPETCLKLGFNAERA